MIKLSSHNLGWRGCCVSPISGEKLNDCQVHLLRNKWTYQWPPIKTCSTPWEIKLLGRCIYCITISNVTSHWGWERVGFGRALESKAQ